MRDFLGWVNGGEKTYLEYRWYLSMLRTLDWARVETVSQALNMHVFLSLFSLCVGCGPQSDAPAAVTSLP